MMYFISTGHFAIFNTDGFSEAKIAQLESESMEAVDQACLEIWHFAQAWSLNCEYFLIFFFSFNHISNEIHIFYQTYEVVW